MEDQPPCIQGSTRYKDPQPTKVQIIQLPATSTVPIINCRIQIQFFVGWCGTNTLVNEAHSPMPMDKMVIFPSAVQCGHAASEGVLEWYIPEFGSAPRTLVRAELVQGVKLGEKFVVGYSHPRSDCRSKKWTSPRGQVVTRAIVAVHQT